MKSVLTLPLSWAALLLPALGADFAQPWPEQTQAPVAAVKQHKAEGVLHTTTHFAIFSPVRMPSATQDALARLLEGCHAACTALPLHFPCDDAAQPCPYRIELFRNREEYAAAAGTHYAATPGIYHKGAILLPLESLGLRAEGENALPVPGTPLATDTLIHELAHQMTLSGATWDTPTWFGEGMAEYVRLAADGRGGFNFSAVKEAVASCVIEGRRLGRELTLPPLEQVMNQSRTEFQQAQGKAGQLNYAFSTLLTWYFIHLDGEGDAANLKRWFRHLQTTPKATAHLRYNLPENPTREQYEAERARLMQQVLATREVYHYEPLLHGRSWQQLEAEFCLKVKAALGIRVHFTPGSTAHTP